MHSLKGAETNLEENVGQMSPFISATMKCHSYVIINVVCMSHLCIMLLLCWSNFSNMKL